MHTVLLAGGAGFMGQHMVKEIQTKHSHTVRLIKIIDKLPFTKTLCYPDNVPVESFTADLSESPEQLGVNEFFQDVDVVFHLCSSRYSLQMNDDRQVHYRDSYKTTETVLALCRSSSVSYLINVADAMQHISIWDHALMPNELKSMAPAKHNAYMLGNYAEFKFTSEQLVLQNNGALLSNGRSLRTASVRATPLYGEGNNWIVEYALKLARSNGGVLPMLGDGKNVTQMTYVGNVVDLLLCLHQHLTKSPEEFGGQVYFSNDRNGSFSNTFMYLKPIVENAGMSLASSGPGYEMSSLGAWIVGKITSAVHYLTGYTLDHNVPPVHVTRVISGLNFHFSSTKARIMLDWLAPYDPSEAMQSTVKWWKDNYSCVLPVSKCHT